MPGHTKLAEGTVVGGDFKVIEPLGVGGMGTVYAAEQLSTGRRRALKVMHGQLLDDEKQRQRFVQEAIVGSSIDSAHVVDVIGAGIEDDGTAWIAMELLDGHDLSELVAKRGPLPRDELWELLEQICHALGAAHEAEIVHRDIKPENICVTMPRQARGRPLAKVLDFGIAKIATRVRTGSTTAIGSPAWMAPEQANPEVAISPATDVWALGVLTFWLLTGRSYWKSVKADQGSIHALMKEILFDPLPRASKRAAELGVADRLPDGFDEWFERCVHREPRARFANAHELLRGLQPLLGGEGPASTERGPDSADDAHRAEPPEPMSTRTFVASGELGTDDVPVSQPSPEPVPSDEEVPP
ncbi:MAG: serine/threonine protein kinase, partial [Deltaproteobacteria bacterium]|nr:serine/threonine protein kinase [Deltaproteobacteria bacterium]MBW2530599.1 serine/threonine protein kinase [Deltaproteobacteria bacterium]